MRFLISLLLFLCTLLPVSAQELLQTIRGTVLDAQSLMSLPGATVLLLNTSPPVGTATDLDGKFRLDNVPVGRQGIQISYLGYNTAVLNNLVLTSAKEIVLTIKLEEKVIAAKEVEIIAKREKAKALNEMSSVSARSFNVEETNRYAGTLLDPSRMVANYAGVAAAGDQRNDIIIRGNSPLGLLWRLDGINIPNPNHFGSLGTTGGPISILNNNLLDNSDFMTGAFPAEYGNALAGAFDLNMRTGNNEKREYIGQVGFNGFELGAEGPFSKNSNASYLASYRYSTLSLFDAMNIDFGVGSVPEYQDLSFKLDFPGLKYGRFSLFGIGGKSVISFLESERDSTDWTFGNAGTDLVFSSAMGATGLNHLYFINENTRIETAIAVSGSGNGIRQDSISTVDRSKHLLYGNGSYEVKYSFTAKLSKKISSRDNFSVGIINDYHHTVYKDSALNGTEYFKLTDTDAGANVRQYYLQWQHKFSNLVTMNSGVHYQQFYLNNTQAVEPRFGLRWQFAEKSSLNFGSGLHSQLQPMAIYFYQTQLEDQSYVKTNENLDFSRSLHIVAGYDHAFNPNLRLILETYYQYLFDLPVEVQSSHFSMANAGADFGIANVDSLYNAGTGNNYGVEITLEKFFSKHYYFLFTGSFFESNYKGSDGITRNTAFNGSFTINGLMGYEFEVGKNRKNLLSFDLKKTWAGGKRYIPINLEASRLAGTLVHENHDIYANRHPDYSRLDLRISFKKNGKKVSQQWALDVQNILNHENIFQETYDPVLKEVRQENQLGVFPIALYRILF